MEPHWQVVVVVLAALSIIKAWVVFGLLRRQRATSAAVEMLIDATNRLIDLQEEMDRENS